MRWLKERADLFVAIKARPCSEPSNLVDALFVDLDADDFGTSCSVDNAMSMSQR